MSVTDADFAALKAEVNLRLRALERQCEAQKDVPANVRQLTEAAVSANEAIDSLSGGVNTLLQEFNGSMADVDRALNAIDALQKLIGTGNFDQPLCTVLVTLSAIVKDLREASGATDSSENIGLAGHLAALQVEMNSFQDHRDEARTDEKQWVGQKIAIWGVAISSLLSLSAIIASIILAIYK